MAALTTIIAIFMLIVSTHLEDNTMCRIVSVPEVAFNGAPMTVEAEYKLSGEIASAKLHVELKGSGSRVYASQIHEVEGAGTASFEFECPIPHEEPMSVAVWLAGNADHEKGTVYLSSCTGKGFKFAPIWADTPYLDNAIVAPFALTDFIQERVTVEMEMTAYNRAWFGEKISVTLEP